MSRSTLYHDLYSFQLWNQSTRRPLSSQIFDSAVFHPLCYRTCPGSYRIQRQGSSSRAQRSHCTEPHFPLYCLVLGSRIQRYHLRVYLSGGSGPGPRGVRPRDRRRQRIDRQSSSTRQDYSKLPSLRRCSYHCQRSPRSPLSPTCHRSLRQQNSCPSSSARFATAKKLTPPSRPERQPITLALLQYLVDRVGSSFSGRPPHQAVISCSSSSRSKGSQVFFFHSPLPEVAGCIRLSCSVVVQVRS